MTAIGSQGSARPPCGRNQATHLRAAHTDET